jgi:hypothetical protein
MSDLTVRPGDQPPPESEPIEQAEPPVAVEPPLPGQTDPPPSEPVGPLEPAASPAAAPEAPIVSAPAKGTIATPRYTGRILVVYGILALALAGAIAAAVVVATGGHLGSSSTKGWSEWSPKDGTISNMTRQIADHIGHQYKLNKKGQQLLAIVSEPPLVRAGATSSQKVAISNLAIRTQPNGKAIRILPATTMWSDEFCGLGPQCSIAGGKASETRGRLVRREALEVALYTFKYVPKIDTVVAFMPPPPGQQPSTLILLQKENLKNELSQPLRKTLPLETPPLPDDPNVKERATIDRLTVPSVYTYKLQQLQDASGLLVLDPFQS